jgi:hypothetical protein
VRYLKNSGQLKSQKSALKLKISKIISLKSKFNLLKNLLCIKKWLEAKPYLKKEVHQITAIASQSSQQSTKVLAHIKSLKH